MKHILNFIKYAALSAIAVGTVTSCLEKYPGSAIPVQNSMKTFSDAEQHLIGIYASLKSGNLYSGSLALLPDIQADLVMASLTNNNPYPGIWEWDIRPTNEHIEGVYGALYSVIGNCNFYLDRIADVIASETDEDNLETLDAYTGEVYAIRALCYSELIKCFCAAYPAADSDGSIPDDEAARNLPGVVLRTKYFEPEPVKRASLYDSWQHVLDDLDRAEELLDDGDDDPSASEDDVYDNYYISPAAVYAIRSRVALYMRDWEDAVTYSSYVIDNGAFALSGTSVNQTTGYTGFDSLWYYDTGTEIIWRIGFTGTSYGGALGTVFLNYTRDYTYLYPDYVPSEWVVGLYSSSDIRYLAYFADASVTGIQNGYSFEIPVPLVVKYWGNRSFTNTYQLYHVSMPKPLRLAEQYLIRAEANCRLGNTGLATNDLTTLSQNRGAGAVSVGSDWMETISRERVKELYMEGFRLNDLKRWNMGFERTPNSYSQTEGNDLEISADDPLFVWPIPQHEIEAPGSDIEGNPSNNR